jgi:phosphopantothenoylcysteine decarboxylase/phosphopantothenate--cysteine ligase
VKFLVSAGPTREFFDSVRFISNPSSGRMGYAIARQAARRGHEVTLVSGPVSLAEPAGVKVVQVTTAAEMAEACKRAFRGADVAVMTAAVCDYRPADRLEQKLAKSNRRRRVVLEPTEDIASSLGTAKGRRLLVGFAMEDHDARAHAEAKCARKNCDLIVLNGPGNVGGDRAEVEFFTPDGGWSEPVRGTKAAVAQRLVRMIETMAESREAGAIRKRCGSKGGGGVRRG